MHPNFCIFRHSARLAVLATLLLSALSLPAQPPAAFPGALGFGANATGGHGTSVYHITNLNDSGTGSFRDAVGGSNRIIVFDVGGYVQLLSPVSTGSNITIAGQTAPGAGFGVFGCEVSFFGKTNCVVRYIRFRDGSLDPNWAGLTSGSSHTNAVNAGSTTNTIFDHCDFEFAAYNNVDATGCVNLTVQYCIFAYPIKNQVFNGHFETGPMTFLCNLWADAHNRNPLGKANLQYVNNVVYNYQDGMTTGNSAGKFTWDVINNYFIAGPSTSSPGANYFQVDSNQSAYATGNLLDGDKNGVLNGSPANSVDATTVLNAPWSNTTSSLPTVTAASAVPLVTSSAGVLPRDQVDAIVISDATSLGTRGTLYNTQADSGLPNSGYGIIANSTAATETNPANGMPDYWLDAVGFSPSADNHNIPVAASPASYMPTTGYNALDEYLYFCAAPHAVCLKNTVAAPANVTIDLSQYAGGYATSATYSLSNITNGSAVLQPDGHTVLFTPTVNFFGRANFDFTVNDGRTLTQTHRVIVTPLTPPPPPSNYIWKGDGVTNTWDASSLNWLNGNNTLVAYVNGNNATFDDTGSASPSINLTASLSPAFVNVASAQNYTFSGTGNLTGSMALNKSGAGTLTLSNANTYTGGTNIASGTVVLGNLASAGTGNISITNATLIQNPSGAIGNNLLISGNCAFNINNTSNNGLGGTLSGNGTLNLTGPGFSNGHVFSWQGVAGQLTAFNGTIVAAGSSTERFNGSSGSNTTGFNLGTSSSITTRSPAGTIYLGSLSGGPATSLSEGTTSGGGNTTFVIGGLNTDAVFSGNINDGGGTGNLTGITKIGTGTFTFNGNINYSGNTTVSGGTLVINGTFPGVVSSVGSGVLSPGGLGNPVTLNVGTLILTGGNCALDLSNSPSGRNDQIVATNGISVSGNETFLINLINGTLSPGVYVLVSSTGALGAASGTGLFSNLPSGNRQTYAITRPSSGTAPGYIRLTVTGSPASLVWAGKISGTWDNTTSNWVNGVIADKFFNSDAVIFNGTDTNSTVTLSGTVQPSSLTFINTKATPYTLTGSGSISGTGLFVKNGNGTVTVNTSNSFSGGSQLNNGTVVLGSPTALGIGNIALNGANLTLPANASLANNLAVSAASTLTVTGNNTLAGTVSGAGNISLQITAGNQLFTLQGDASTYFGTIFAQGNGTLRFNNGANWGLPNATLVLAGNLTADNQSTDDLNLFLGALTGGANTTLTASDQSAAGGSLCTLIIGGLNLDSSFSGNITDSANQAISLTKTGTGTLTLAGSNNSYSGDTFVQSGTLIIAGNITGDGDMDIATGATLSLASGDINIGTLTIESGAFLSGNGTIDGDLVLNGLATSTLGGSLTVTGDVVNNNVLRLTGGTQLNISGTFTNGPNAVLDLITSGSNLPAHFVNHGTVLLASSVQQVASFGVSGATATLQVQSYVGHNFQLQATTTLGGAWQNLGSAQPGTGGILTFTDPNYSAHPAIFYRITVSP